MSGVCNDIGGTAAAVAREGAGVWVGWRGATYELRTDPAERRVEDIAASEIDAPMPGVVLSLHAAAGQHVRRGDLIVVLEAMKMEQPLNAHKSGTVTGLSAAVGEVVTAGAALCEIKD